MDIHSNISSVPARAYMFLPNISSLYATLLVFKMRLFNNGLSPEFWLKSSHLPFLTPVDSPCKEGVTGKECTRCAKGYIQSESFDVPCVSKYRPKSYLHFFFCFLDTNLVIHGFPWPSIAFRGHPWPPMAVHGHPAKTKTASTPFFQKSHHHADIQTIQSARQNARKNARQIDQSIWALTNFVKWDSVLILLLLQCSHQIIKFWELKSKEEKILATIFWSLQMW